MYVPLFHIFSVSYFSVPEPEYEEPSYNFPSFNCDDEFGACYTRIYTRTSVLQTITTG
jgi:hypothetical protein